MLLNKLLHLYLRPYKITGVKDTAKDKMLKLEEASKAGILDEPRGIFTDTKAKKKILVSEAIQVLSQRI